MMYNPGMSRVSLGQRILKALGPGFITGAADDDPSGIATYSQTGAMFGYTQLWLSPFSYPFMVAVQELCGRIGIVTGRGISGVLRAHYSRSVLVGAIALLLAANIINIGADLGAMAASLQLLVPLPFPLLLAGITIFIIGLQVYVPYPLYARFLKYLTLSLLSYIAVAFIAHVEWGEVLHSTLIPHIVYSNAYLMNIAAFLGTTISPYLFFWQADEEVEEEVQRHELRTMGAGIPHFTQSDISGMRIDTALGMLFSQIITFFIIVSVAATLSSSGGYIETAAQAAQALRPVAGDFAFFLFALGIIGTGLLAVPVLAGSVSYAVAEAFHWREGLAEKPARAPGFYGMIVAVTLAGVFVNFSPVGPITLLYWAAIMNGLLAPPLMLLLLFVGNNRSIMGSHVNSTLSNVLIGITTLIMGFVAIALLYSLIGA
jgi:NRAMP (natural resistance-associated macrophage protein)-like metal ion transporter